MSGITFSSTGGAEIVSKTLDTLNGVGSSSLTPTDKQTFGAAVVSKTLDYMNSGSSTGAGMSQTYQFSKDVLSTYTSGVGRLANVSV